MAWGNSGGTPAVALLHRGREPVILLPGSGDDGATLAAALLRKGHRTAARLFLPEGSPFPYGAEKIAAEMQIRQMTVLVNPRSRITGKELRERLSAEGTALEHLLPAPQGGYRTAFGTLEYAYAPLPGGRFRLVLSNIDGAQKTRAALLEMKETGEVEISFPESGLPPKAIPKSNRRGIISLPLPQ